jgi:hypothetical protein
VSAFNNGFLDSFDGLQTLYASHHSENLLPVANCMAMKLTIVSSACSNVSSNNLSSIYSSLPSMSPESVAAVRSMYEPLTLSLVCEHAGVGYRLLTCFVRRSLCSIQ